MFLTLVFTTSVITVIIITAKYYTKSKLNKNTKLILYSVRLILMGLILLSFFEPSLKLNKLMPNKNNVTIVIDASKSMKLFDANIQLKKLLNTIHESDIKEINLYLFGDSLRLASDCKINFSDNKSFYPIISDINNIRKSRTTILFTDGNWSNSNLNLKSIRNNNIFYLKLKQILQKNFLTINASVKTDRISNKHFAIVYLNGYSDSSSSINVSCEENNKLISYKNKFLSKGYFTDSLWLELNSKKSGFHIYTIKTHSNKKRFNTYCKITDNVYKQKISCKIINTNQSLDKRFLSLTIKKNKNWSLNNSRNKLNTDIIFVMDINKKTQKIINNTPNNTTIIFIGCTPNKNIDKKLNISDSDTLILTDYIPPKYQNMKIFPLPYMLALEKNKNIKSLINFVTKNKSSSIVSESLYNGKKTLIIGVKEFWKWDFLTVNQNNYSTKFSDYILYNSKKIFNTNTNTKMQIYSGQSKIFNTDSIKLNIIFPFSMIDKEFTKISISVKNNSNKLIIDSSFTVSTNSDLKPQIILPPLPSGKYSVKCNADHKNTKTTVTVIDAQSEFKIHEQNEVLLNQFFTPLSLYDIKNILEKNKQTESILTKTISINKSKFIFILIVLLFTTEWFIRKINKLD